ncbi:hypothetical protein NGG16_02695 [Enterococcus casseliflavus]|uniref:hypothetical protein n=1 Tax=Enterococcus casseliflavus TaxID=37734 RepID=UPI002DB61C80|nr:hypothetical protein [Enterococcus casseliflavus]MEB8416342.1 hypothetical protein [Enterococcus casseliflavus]
MERIKTTQFREKKRFLQRNISHLTYPENWFENPERVRIVQHLNKELEQMVAEETKCSISDFEELTVENYFKLKKIGFSDREIAMRLDISKYFLHKWKEHNGLTPAAIRKFFEGDFIGTQ